MNIITYWIETLTRTPGYTIADALRDLNETTGRRLTHSRLREMERGEVALMPDLYRLMLEETIHHALSREGVRLNDAALDRIVERLAAPARKHRLAVYAVTQEIRS